MINRIEDSISKIRGVDKIIKHENYSPRTYKNDIGLLKLNETVQFDNFIKSICLPSKHEDYQTAVGTGFGITGPNHALSSRLMEVELEKFSHEECQKILPNKIDEQTMLCYGDHQYHRKACQVNISISSFLSNF